MKMEGTIIKKKNYKLQQMCMFSSGRLAISVYSINVPVMLHVELGRMQLFGCQMRSRTTQKAGSWRARSLGGADTAE